MKKILLTLSLLFFAFPVLSLVHFHKGGGDKLLTSQPNSPSGTLATSSDIPWDATIDRCRPNAEPTQKVTLPDDNFLSLFFKHKQKVIDTFNWIVDRFPVEYSRARAQDNLLKLVIAYSCRFREKTTIPIPRNGIATVIRSRSKGRTVFQIKAFKSMEVLNRYSYGDWNHFLSQVSRNNTATERAEKLVGVNSSDKDFFWKRFFKAYLYFLAMTKMDSQADNTFLTFLDNLKIERLLRMRRFLDTFQKEFGWLDALPGVSFNAFGDDDSDLVQLFNQDPSTFDGDSFPPEYKKYYLTTVETHRSHPYRSDGKVLPIAQPYLTLINKVFNVIKHRDFWEQLQAVLSNPWGIKSLFFNNQEYSLENLANTLPQSGYKLVTPQGDKTPFWQQNFNALTNAAVAELVTIIFGNSSDTAQGVNSGTKLQQRFQATKRKLLNPLKTTLDQIVSLDSTITQLTIEGKPYDLNHLILAKDQILENDFEKNYQQAFAQAKELVDDKITGNQIKNAFDQLNNPKLNNLWTRLQPKLEKYANLSSFQITIGSGDNAKVYSLDQLFQDREETTGSNLPNGKSQLQTLVNDGVSVQQITTQLDNLVAKAKAEKEEAEKKKAKEVSEKNKKNLAIGLGTAGGVVALAGAGGFAFWFLKIRKS